MKLIAEMTLEELQDYAAALEEEKTALEGQVTERDTSIAELTETNLALQKRNNTLFMQVEQGRKSSGPDQGQPEQVETCEDFALNKLKGVLR